MVYQKIYGEIIQSKLRTLNYKKTKITFYKSNFSFPIIKIIYSKKFDKEIFEITYRDKKKNFSTLNSLNAWLKNYFFN